MATYESFRKKVLDELNTTMTPEQKQERIEKLNRIIFEASKIAIEADGGIEPIEGMPTIGDGFRKIVDDAKRERAQLVSIQ